MFGVNLCPYLLALLLFTGFGLKLINYWRIAHLNIIIYLLGLRIMKIALHLVLIIFWKISISFLIIRLKEIFLYGWERTNLRLKTSILWVDSSDWLLIKRIVLIIRVVLTKKMVLIKRVVLIPCETILHSH